jgi:hypothetical protein
MSCDALRSSVESCSSAGPDCTCFVDGGGSQEFVDAVDGAFKKTQAFVMTTDPAYCDVAAQNIDDEVALNWSCCCAAEVDEYITCTFNQELAVAFGLVGCERSASSGDEEGEGDGDDDGGLPLMYIIIGVVVVMLLLCCCCGCYCWRRRRLAAAANAKKGEVNVNVNMTSETKNVTENVTSNQGQGQGGGNNNNDGNTQNSKTVSP